ncbi:hypothetical protein CDAR_46381 [Caerostris darwini]|uniref:Uncharacterized protein n=1 Tax=Caerostris darwini TaxID=1538125 RepID=A0AAV4PVC4_9ARAC|nr:hypothetical protein CDAR_46381 [Caerostris darwini]
MTIYSSKQLDSQKCVVNCHRTGLRKTREGVRVIRKIGSSSRCPFQSASLDRCLAPHCQVMTTPISVFVSPLRALTLPILLSEVTNHLSKGGTRRWCYFQVGNIS